MSEIYHKKKIETKVKNEIKNLHAKIIFIALNQ